MESQVAIYSVEQVCTLLGVPNTCTVPMPEPSSLKPGEVLLWYPGCTLAQLRHSPLGKKHMWQSQKWYDEQKFASAEPGYYAVQLRVPDSNGKIWQEQQALLSKISEAYKPAPAAVAATALLLDLKETGNDLLQDDWCRCVEEAAAALPRFRVALTVCKGCVGVGAFSSDRRFYNLWLAAARKI